MFCLTEAGEQQIDWVLAKDHGETSESNAMHLHAMHFPIPGLTVEMHVKKYGR